MLILLLPSVHRHTLRVILDLCARIVEYEDENKMGLYNIAMIMAPNIFLPSFQPKSKIHLRGEDKDHQLNSEMEYAKITTQLVQALIKYRDVLWVIPNRLISQIRHQYEASLKVANSKPIHKLLAKKNKDLIHRPIVNEVDYQNGVLRISAPQFSKINHPIKLDWKMTAKDILTWFIEDESTAMDHPQRVPGRREHKQILYRSSSSNGTSSTPSSYSNSSSDAVAMTTCLSEGICKACPR
ncbi:Rho GTPase-activating protein 18 [Armadillidium vulgare]|nr:Rho GTPase-activating protein 18 [Armadillidium vulgare]